MRSVIGMACWLVGPLDPFVGSLVDKSRRCLKQCMQQLKCVVMWAVLVQVKSNRDRLRDVHDLHVPYSMYFRMTIQSQKDR